MLALKTLKLMLPRALSALPSYFYDFRGTSVFHLSICWKQLQYWKERGSNCNYYDRSSIAEKETLQLLQSLQYLQTERKLQSLRPHKYCTERGTAITRTVPVLQEERNCNYYKRSSIAAKETVMIAAFQKFCRKREPAIATTPPVLQKRTPACAADAGGVHDDSGVWCLKLTKSVLPRVLLGRGPPHGDHTIRQFAA